MKKRTKIASLFLAMLMAFSLMAVTAAAYDAGHEHDCAMCSEEGIEPRKPAALCRGCGQDMDEIARGTDIYGNGYITFQCKNPYCENPGLLVLPW